jgi:hypothetical protein
VRGLKKIRRETSVCIVAVEAFSVQRKESEERAEAIQFEPLVQKGIKKQEDVPEGTSSCKILG